MPLQHAAEKYPMAGVFFIETHIVLLDWPEVDNTTAVSFLRRLDRSVSAKLDNSGRGKSSPKVVFRPERVTAVSTHDAKLKAGYTRWDR